MAAELIITDTLDEALEQVGLPCPRSVELAAGKICRWDDPDEVRGNRGIWCLSFPDARGAAFGNWCTGARHTWQMRRYGPPPDRTEIERLRAQAEAARREADAAREADYEAAAARARTRWDKAQPAQDHLYLARKAIKPHGCRIEGDNLLVPVLNDQGVIQSLEAISPDGQKRFQSGGRMAGGRFWIGEPGQKAAIAEGFATGAAIHEATGLPVCIAFAAGNLLAVAKRVRKAYPDARIVLAADNDMHPDRPNVGREKAQAAAEAVGGTVVLPDLDGRPCDWWDVRHERGDAAVQAAFNPPPRYRLLARDELQRLPELSWLVDGVLPETGIGLVIGQSGHGKSFAAIDLLERVALGMPWFGHATEARKTVYMALEGRAGIKCRVNAWEAANGLQSAPDFAVVLPQRFALTQDADVHDLAHAILEAGGDGGLVIVDTLAQASPGTDENVSADMSRVIDGMQRLQALTGGLALAVHHLGKDPTKGARGHSSLYAACDVVLACSKVDNVITLSTDGATGGKSKDGEPVEHQATLERIVLRTLADGYEIAGAALVESSATPVKLPKRPRGRNMTIVWDHLGAMLKAARDTRPEGAPIALPEGRPTVRLEDARGKVCPLLPVETKYRNQRFNEAITGLVAGGWLGHLDGWIWCK